MALIMNIILDLFYCLLGLGLESRDLFVELGDELLQVLDLVRHGNCWDGSDGNNSTRRVWAVDELADQTTN